MVPGPVTCDHDTTNWLPGGWPSSVATPLSTRLAVGSVIARSGPASTDGGAFCRSTTTVTVSSVVFSPSLARRRSVKVPACGNVATVDACVGDANTTTPGPSTCDHCTANTLPAGFPSSPALPANVAVAGSVIVASGPASTVGAAFGAGNTVTVTVSLAASSPSFALRRSS